MACVKRTDGKKKQWTKDCEAKEKTLESYGTIRDNSCFNYQNYETLISTSGDVQWTHNGKPTNEVTTLLDVYHFGDNIN